MTTTRSLLDTCVSAIAQYLPYTINVTPATVPEPELVQRIYLEYSREPAVLSLKFQQLPGSALAELSAFSGSLRHLELSSAASNSLTSLTNLTNLACLSLRGCLALQETELRKILQGLTQLQALDLCGVPAVTDELVPTLASMPQLQVLNLNRTQCTDLSVDWLTYGHRLHAWQEAAERQQQQQKWLAGPAASAHPANQGQHVTTAAEQWPRCKIRQWHLANTRITPHAAEFLWSLPDLTFLDMRGSGVTASQLVALRAKFLLRTPQGAVLSRSAAMAAAAVSLDAFVCCQPAEHCTIAAGNAGAGGGGRCQPCSYNLQHWVQERVTELIQARTEIEQQAAAQACERIVVTAQLPSVARMSDTEWHS